MFLVLGVVRSCSLASEKDAVESSGPGSLKPKQWKIMISLLLKPKYLLVQLQGNFFHDSLIVLHVPNVLLFKHIIKANTRIKTACQV